MSDFLDSILDLVLNTHDCIRTTLPQHIPTLRITTISYCPQPVRSEQQAGVRGGGIPWNQGASARWGMPAFVVRLGLASPRALSRSRPAPLPAVRCCRVADVPRRKRLQRRWERTETMHRDTNRNKEDVKTCSYNMSPGGDGEDKRWRRTRKRQREKEENLFDFRIEPVVVVLELVKLHFNFIYF